MSIAFIKKVKELEQQINRQALEIEKLKALLNAQKPKRGRPRLNENG